MKYTSVTFRKVVPNVKRLVSLMCRLDRRGLTVYSSLCPLLHSLPSALFSNSERESWRTARVHDRTVHTHTHEYTMQHSYTLTYICFHWLLSAPLNLPANHRQGRSASQPITLLILSTSSHSLCTILELKQEKNARQEWKLYVNIFFSSFAHDFQNSWTRVCAGFCFCKWWGTWLMLNLPVHRWDETSVDHEEGSFSQSNIHSAYPNTHKETWTPV